VIVLVLLSLALGFSVGLLVSSRLGFHSTVTVQSAGSDRFGCKGGYLMC
jgi:hypothetical protein